MPKRMIWKDTQQVLSEMPCTCIDGRTPGPRFSAAGGSFGVAAWILSQYEQLLGRSLRVDEIQQAFELYISEIGPLYLHSDQDAIQRIFSRMGLPADLQLEQLTDSQRQLFIHLAKQGDNQGCGHIKQMLQHSTDYSIRSGLLADAIGVLLELYFAGHPKVQFDVLSGQHQETQVLMLDEAEPTEQSALLQANQEQVFFCHQPLKNLLIGRFVSAIEQAWPQWPRLTSIAALSKQHDRTAERTLAALAPHLPVETRQLEALA